MKKKKIYARQKLEWLLPISSLKSRHRSEVTTWFRLERVATWILRLRHGGNLEEQLEVATRNGCRDLAGLGRT